MPKLLARLVAPTPLPDRAEEAEFWDEYSNEGRATAATGLAVGALITAAAEVLATIRPFTSYSPPELHYLRILLVVVLATFSYLLAKKSEINRSTYQAMAGVPCAIALVALNTIWVIRSFGGDAPPPSGRMATLTILSIWLCVGFLRLGTHQLTGLTVFVGGVTSIAILKADNDDSVVLLAYIAFAALSARIYCIERESRERLLFSQARELYSLSDELRNSLRQERASSETMNSMIRALSHDLRQPLASASLYCSALMRTGASSATGGSLTRKIKYCVDVALAELECILDRDLRTPGGVGTQTEVAISTLFDRLIEIYDPLAQDRGATLRRCGHNLWGLYGITDEIYLMRSLGNLIDNAIKFAGNSESTPSILVCATRLKDVIRIDVIDNGRGFSAQEFAKSERHRKSTTQPRSRGLGLKSAEMLLNSIPHHRMIIHKLRRSGGRVSVYLPRAKSDTNAASKGR